MNHKISRLFEINQKEGLPGVIKGSNRFLSRRILNRNLRFRYYTRLNQINNKIKYTVTESPYKKIQLTPDRITKRNRKISLEFGLGRIKPGEWDKKSFSLKNDHAYASIRQHFTQGTDWDETPLYEYARKNISENGSYNGYTSIEDYEETRLQYVDELYKSIERSGYVEGYKHDTPGIDVRSNKKRFRHSLEIIVCISRNGEIVLHDGIHRFTIAEILETPIYVNILARHEKWQEQREELLKQNKILTNPKETHPDLRHHI